MTPQHIPNEEGSSSENKRLIATATSILLCFPLAPGVPTHHRTLAIRRQNNPELVDPCGGNLLKLTIGEHENRTVLRLEGRLIGPWTSLVEQCWRETAERTAKPVTIDLTGVTFVDDLGKMLLGEMHEHGTVLQTRGPLMDYIVDQIRNKSPFVGTSYLGT